MNELIHQEKHEIAILTELTLYNRIRAFDEDDNISKEDKKRLKDEAIEVFVASCIEKYNTLTPSQIKEHVLFVLDRTIQDEKKISSKYER